ncbi:hypothetical protein K8O93_01810 [Gordonia bronchialis]|uniref:hypothetical protein n=1 Tax=Gordonia bronchialis TaxID=2054 RepID=UPI001CBCA320|nr:hypothetical protein [Gordonia bronchialis]UAK38555.1 hypothetical protein K8O93_01810 [Gordonia bronchialis]
MRRVDRRPAGSWMRDAWLTDEATLMTAAQHEQITGQPCPLLAALEAGAEVTAHMWQLPNVIADRLRAEGCPPSTLFRLTADDELEVV